ncbi:uncharacterized protein STEHIDRAFT_163733 [Stereum hirsutum FP-91666 SS1]|uniref:Uncharacterized protein n=1 Tax=Stereum hirsutum (strain FP-91666) TaxID=721885 RepID=R7RVX4_STEHR|nr:uncharacterized protein STEHIDRAFT_163733 [Stereum hirsutum FP-91666 SS1]EIM79374.1 hypothetical protein STEHIDRAFT_163733 [Stereum hirsutum FP-91666 SS1]
MHTPRTVYLDPITTTGYQGWLASVIIDGLPDTENSSDALKNGPYCQCVYESSGDVCDNQVVNIQYDSGATVSFTMVAFTFLICERPRVTSSSSSSRLGRPDGALH